MQEGGVSDDVRREIELFGKADRSSQPVDVARGGIVPQDRVDGDDVAFCGRAWRGGRVEQIESDGWARVADEESAGDDVIQGRGRGEGSFCYRRQACP